MFKRIIPIILSVAICAVSITGCSTSSELDDNVDMLVADYLQNYSVTQSDGNDTSIDDTLALMLDGYVSGLGKPAIEDIQTTDIEPTDEEAEIFDNFDENSDGNCKSVAELKSFILKALADTVESATFYLPASLYSDEMLYDVVFNQICEEYMIETMGLYQYTTTTMQTTGNRIAINIEFGYFDGSYRINEVKKMKSEVLNKAKDIVHDLGLANMTEYERVYAVNEYLCNNCVYPDKEPYSSESYTTYGALIQQSAVCEGYARSAQLLFMLCNIDSYFVTGDTPEGGHAWNLVKVDGQYYQLDITWNDVEFGKNMYFLVTDQTMKKSRVWDYSRYPASAKKAYSPLQNAA